MGMSIKWSGTQCLVRMEEMCAVAHTILRTIIAAIISAGILLQPFCLKLHDKHVSTHHLPHQLFSL